MLAELPLLQLWARHWLLVSCHCWRQTSAAKPISSSKLQVKQYCDQVLAWWMPEREEFHTSGLCLRGLYGSQMCKRTKHGTDICASHSTHMGGGGGGGGGGRSRAGACRLSQQSRFLCWRAYLLLGWRTYLVGCKYVETKSFCKVHKCEHIHESGPPFLRKCTDNRFTNFWGRGWWSECSGYEDTYIYICVCVQVSPWVLDL